jgi:multidrug resistance protein MdtO
MAPVPIHPHTERFSDWFPDFLKKELAPYPGRGTVVARMVISATLTMILIETFHIPSGVIGPLTAFLLSRENLVATARSAFFLIAALAIAALFIPVGARFFASTPETHFIWLGCSLFMVFFLLRCLANYAVAIGLAVMVANVVGIWYLPGPGEQNVELTLWLVAATATGTLVTLCVEIVAMAIHKRDDLIVGIDARLALIADQMKCYGDGRPVSSATQAGLAQFAIVGNGVLRRMVARDNYAPLYRARMSTLVSLTGRTIDFAAALANAYPSLLPGLEERAAGISRSLEDIRQCLRTHGQPCEATLVPTPSPGTALLSEIETAVSLMPSVFSKEHSVDPALEPLEDQPDSTRIFIPDAFSNPEHLQFVLGGTLAAMLCYVFYVALDWPGLSTAVTTCVLTALTTIGSSRQKQVLRLAGNIIGGFIFGLGAQIFVLPYIDTIGGFTLLFATVTFVAAWLATSSSRLSYAGVQVAFAFYLIHVTDFSIQTNLTLSRDKVLGVVLGITMMWLVFERFFPRSAADEMVRMFVIDIRMMAELISSIPLVNEPATLAKVRQQRDRIYRGFEGVGAQSDAVPFETGPLRPGDMAARERIVRWQASLRTFYLLEAPLLQFRIFAGPVDRSHSFRAFHDEFRSECSLIFLHIAGSLESQMATRTHRAEPVSSLVSRIDSLAPEIESQFSERERFLMHLLRTIAQLVDHLQQAVAAEGLYDLPEVQGTLPGLSTAEATET